MSTAEEINHATEVMMDAFLGLVRGKDDDDLVFIDGALRSVAEELKIPATWDEIEPITAGEFRRRYRVAKERLAAGGGPG